MRRRRSRSACSTRCGSAASRWRTRSWTRATTTARSMTAAWTVASAPSRRCAPDHGRRAWRPQAPRLRARRVDVRPDRLQAAGHQVALPDWRVPAKVDVGQGRPDARADPTPHGAVAQALREPWRYRARVRSAKARMGDAAAARARNRARAPARRPDDPRQARLRALTSARRPSLPQGRGRRRRSKTRQTTSAIKAAVSETPLGLSRRPIATWTFNSSLMTSASSSQRRRSSGLSGSSSTRTTLAPRFANRFVKPS